MTIIVWDGKTLAADRLVSREGHASSVDKIYRHGAQLIAVSGSLPYAMRMFRWYIGPADQPFPQPVKDEYASLVVVQPNATLHVLHPEGCGVPVIYDDRQFAQGSGRDYAYGAMAMGAPAVVAASIACQFDVNCGMGVTALDLHPAVEELPDPDMDEEEGEEEDEA